MLFGLALLSFWPIWRTGIAIAFLLTILGIILLADRFFISLLFFANLAEDFLGIIRGEVYSDLSLKLFKRCYWLFDFDFDLSALLKGLFWCDFL